MDETAVVTPEGVLLNYRPAGLATRTMGRLIDLSLMAIVAYTAFSIGLVLLLSGSTTPIVIYLIALGFFVFFGYPVGFEVYGGGRTPGHRATGTKVIRTDGGPIGLRHSAIRAMLFFVDGIATTGFAGAVSVLVTKRGQRLGDLAAGTMVVRIDRPVLPPGPPPTLADDLRTRALEFDRRRVNAADAATARMLMERGAQLREGAQVDLATRVADRLDSQLGNVKLDSDSPVDFIYAVLEGDGSRTTPMPPADPPTATTEAAEIMTSFLEPGSEVDDHDALPSLEGERQEAADAPAAERPAGGEEDPAGEEEDAATDDPGFTPPT